MSFFSDFQHKVFIFIDRKSLLLLPTMYILVLFKLSYKNILTLINRVKIPIFCRRPPASVVVYQICRYKCKKIALLSLLLRSKIPIFTLLFKNVEPYLFIEGHWSA